MDVIASFRTNVAVPNDAGLGAPPTNVGTVGGFSWEFVRFAKRKVAAFPLVLATNTTTGTKKNLNSRRMDEDSFRDGKR